MRRQASALVLPPWRDLPRRTRRIELGLAGAAAVLVLIGLLGIETGYGFDDPGGALLLGAYGVLVPAAALNRCLSRPSGLRAVVHGMVTGRRSDPAIPQLRHLGLPGLAVWLLPLVLLPFELLLVPIGGALHLDQVDPGLPFLLTLLGLGMLLLGLLVWMIVVLPLVALGLAAVDLLPGRRAASGGLAYESRLAAGMACILLSIVAFATLLVLAAPGPEDASSHAMKIPQFLALLGLDPGIVEHPVLIWLARVAAVAVALSVVLVIRIARRGKREGALRDVER